MGASRHARHGQDSHRFGARATVLPEKRRIQRCEKRYTELKRTKVLMRDAAIENSEAAVAELTARKWPDTLVELFEVVSHALKKRATISDDTDACAIAAVRAIAFTFGGRSFYLPRGNKINLALRDAEIFQRANRNNIDDLAIEFEISQVRIYQILKQQRLLRDKRASALSRRQTSPLRGLSV